MSFTSLWYSSGEAQLLSDGSGGDHNTPEPTLVGVVLNHPTLTSESMSTTLTSRNVEYTNARTSTRRVHANQLYDDVIPSVDSHSSDPGPDVLERYSPLPRRTRSDSSQVAPHLEPRVQQYRGHRGSLDQYTVSSPTSTPVKSTETSLTLTPSSSDGSDDSAPFDEDIELGHGGNDRRKSRSTVPSSADISAVRGQVVVGEKNRNFLGKSRQYNDEHNNNNNSNRKAMTKSASANRKQPNYALRKSEREALLKKKKHVSFCAYGKVLTLLSIMFASTAVVFAILARRSLSFVRVEEALDISPLMYGVQDVGLLRTKFCYNETAVEIAHKANNAVMNDDTTTKTAAPSTMLEHTGCFILDMGVDMIDDTMWNMSRTFLSLAILMGLFLFLMLLLSIFWESINLKPVAIGLLVTYFFQSLSFFFFDSELCRGNVCRLGEGSTFSIVACLFWFVSGLATIRMDVVYQSEQRRLARRRKRAIKKLKLQRRFKEMKDATFRSSSTMTDPTSPDQSVVLRKTFPNPPSEQVQPGLDDVPDQDIPTCRKLNDLFDDAAEEREDLREWYSEDAADLDMLTDELYDDLDLKLSYDLELDESIDDGGISKELFHI